MWKITVKNTLENCAFANHTLRVKKEDYLEFEDILWNKIGKSGIPIIGQTSNEACEYVEEKVVDCGDEYILRNDCLSIDYIEKLNSVYPEEIQEIIKESRDEFKSRKIGKEGNPIRKELLIKSNACLNSAFLTFYMSQYSHSMDECDRKGIDLYAKGDQTVALPIARWGNAIALALEINDYVVAEYLIENAERLELRTDFVASEFGYKNCMSLKEEYLYSQNTYKEEPMSKDDYANKKEYQEYIDEFMRNKEANKRLEEKLNVTSKDKEKIKKK